MKRATPKQTAANQETPNPETPNPETPNPETPNPETLKSVTLKSATPKSATPKKPKSATAGTPIRILKRGTCPSLSGKSKLTYQIGCTAASEIQVRVCGNDGGGMFGDEFVSLNAIQELFAKVPADKPLTSFLLVPLFEGKSANTPGFLFAVLKHEGLVQAGKDKQRSYERGDPKKFMAEVKALMASKVDLMEEDKPKKAKVQPQKAEAQAEAQGEKAEAQKIEAQPTPAATIKKAASETASKAA